MHELPITESVVDAILEHVGDAKVISVQLEIGKLSGVVPDAVRFCFDIVCAGTPLEGARLDIVEPEGSARCRDCHAEFPLAELVPLCPCGSVDVEITGGQQLRVRSVEVV